MYYRNIKWFSSKNESYVTVSYTHLDVYKRQALRFSHPLLSPGCYPRYSFSTGWVDLVAEKRTLILWCGPGTSRLVARCHTHWSTEPVSYTHLFETNDSLEYGRVMNATVHVIVELTLKATAKAKTKQNKTQSMFAFYKLRSTGVSDYAFSDHLMVCNSRENKLQSCYGRNEI